MNLHLVLFWCLTINARAEAISYTIMFELVMLSLIELCGALKIDFYLVTPEDPVIRLFSPDSYGGLIFNTSRPYKIFSHGWKGESFSGNWYNLSTDAYMKRGDVNIIRATYNEAMDDRIYVGSVCNVYTIGKTLGKMLVDLHKKKAIPYENMHLIGHSLGAHIAGIAGETIKQLANTKVARITGLDPAWPGFSLLNMPYKSQNRLSKDDAYFVDIIHSSSKLGIRRPIGTLDFFPNGGEEQNGCEQKTFCNHIMAPMFWHISVHLDFPARKCASWDDFQKGICEENVTTIMGDRADVKMNGNFYLTTDAKLGKEVREANEDKRSWFTHMLTRKAPLEMAEDAAYCKIVAAM